MCRKINICVYGKLRCSFFVYRLLFLYIRCPPGNVAKILLEICLGTPPRLSRDKLEVIKFISQRGIVMKTMKTLIKASSTLKHIGHINYIICIPDWYLPMLIFPLNGVLRT